MKRRLFGKYKESAPAGQDGRPGHVNDWLQFAFLLPILILFGAFCWLTTQEPEFDPCSLPPTPQEEKKP